MLKKQATLLFALVLTLLFAAVFAHQAPAQTKAAKEPKEATFIDFLDSQKVRPVDWPRTMARTKHLAAFF